MDLSHFEEKDAGATESAVYESFLAKKEAILNEIMTQLQSADAAAYKDCSNEMKAYQSYIVATLLTSDMKVLVSDKIDREDEVYLQWEKEENISAYTYLNHCISKGWIDTSILKNYVKDEGKYSDLNQTFEGLINYVMERLSIDSDFDKLIYKYMIRNGEISGRQICMMLFEQGILEYNETYYNSLESGAVTSYDFLKEKIRNLEITPGQLGLEPCTGSVVVTDSNSGDVLACVSYPGYDNNRLANTMDSKYYSKLLNDKATPLYNAATQEKTAPGSTYKPLVSIAGLTEGVINTETEMSCNGVYDKITPTAKCWVYPRSHGSLNVTGAIQHSCNEFFYDVGYKLGLTGEYLTNSENGQSTEIRSDTQGLELLQKYAIMFGLGEKTGIEIPESEPQISDEDAVRSSIGQGTNNYTTVQLARYVSAVANKGTLYELSLLDKVVDIDGNLVKDYHTNNEKEISGISNSTWNAVHQGMRAVVSNSSTYQSLGNFEMSGKTGTAQQSSVHANHGLFVGFAPSNSPEISFAVRIKNGYESAYAAQIGRDVVRYYYDIAEYEQLVMGQASNLSGTTRTD